MHGEHDHPGNPEENDVETGHQHVSGVEGFQRVGFFWPAQGGERPQTRTEPGVEHVVVLLQRNVWTQVVLGTNFGFVAAYVDLARFVVPGRNAVAPPQLTADAPVLDVTHPREVHVFVLLWHERDAAVFNGGNRWFCQWLGRHVPLVGQPRLDDGARAVAFRYFQGVIVDADQQTGFVKVRHDLLARFEAIQTGVFGRQGAIDSFVQLAVEVEHLSSRQHFGVFVEDVQQWQVMALADFVVVEIVGRGDFHAAGAEFRIAVIVSDDRDAATNQWQLNKLADQGLVAFVFRVYRNGSVAEHGFWTGGSNHQVIQTFGGFGAVSQRVAQVPQETFLVVVFHFKVGNCGVQLGVPVDQTLAAVDQTVFVQANKGFFHGFGQAVIHGEAFAAPVYGRAKATDLTADVAAGLVFPFPDLVQELLAAQVMAVQTLCFDLTLNQHLGGDTRVVGARLPQGVATLHAAETDQGVHDRVVKTVTHVQAAGDVRRRDHDGVRVARALRGKIILFFPGFVPGSFNGVRLVGLIHARRDPIGINSGKPTSIAGWDCAGNLLLLWERACSRYGQRGASGSSRRCNREQARSRRVSFDAVRATAPYGHRGGA